jgi:hypothetical protein
MAPHETALASDRGLSAKPPPSPGPRTKSSVLAVVERAIGTPVGEERVGRQKLQPLVLSR